MSPDEFKSLMLRWSRWYHHDHSLRGLGYAQGGYAERVGKSYSTADPADGIDLEVSRWHSFFCEQLPDPAKSMIRIEYLVAGKKSEKHKDVSLSARDYGPALAFALEMARQMFLRAEESRREVA